MHPHVTSVKALAVRWTRIVLALAMLTTATVATAQDPAQEWAPSLEPSLQFPIETPAIEPAPVPATTEIPQNAPAQPTQATNQPAQLNLVAHLIERGKKIDRGIVWRVYDHPPSGKNEPRLIATKRSSSPKFMLKPGTYVVNAAYGRAYLNKTITLTPGADVSEIFVLNAGGLQVIANIDGAPAPPNSVAFDILESEPDQSGERHKIITNVRPQLIVRLNAGIYRIVSRYGKANAAVSADVQVEAGKLSIATVSHSAARVTFKLVERPGGEAIPGTQWSVATPEGETVVKSVGALPTHILAPGTYFVTAKSASGTYKAQFAIEGGQLASVEVVMN